MAALENVDGKVEETESPTLAGNWHGEGENGEVIEARERLIHPFTLLVSKCTFIDKQLIICT